MRKYGHRGFEGRVFLTREEWDVFSRRKPVRYVRRPHGSQCVVCGLGGRADNPLQHAHRIGFDFGISYLSLTPEFLDGPHNIVSAHRVRCNRHAELTLSEALEFLRTLGVVSLPAWLPLDVLAYWEGM